MDAGDARRLDSSAGSCVDLHVPRHRAAVTALLLAASLASARPADACSCIQASLADQAARATAVFVGKPLSATKRPIDAAECAKRKPNRCYYSYTHRVRVEGVWKGAVPRVVTIHAGVGGGDCMFGDLGTEQRWLFITGPNLSISICRGTQPATKTVLDEVRKLLGAPKAPKA
jgi:hypothetical protein